MTKPRPYPPRVDLLRAKNPSVAAATMPPSHKHSEALVFPAKVGIGPKKGCRSLGYSSWPGELEKGAICMEID